VGVKAIDDQHKELLALTNDLFNHCVGDEASERAYFKKIIGKAVEYVKVHFATEEKIMLATKFKGYWNHKMEHDAFVLNVVEQIKLFESGKPFTLLAFTRFLKNWILTHIAVTDKQYIGHFKQSAARNADYRPSTTKEAIK
jgi:hemerythrin